MNHITAVLSRRVSVLVGSGNSGHLDSGNSGHLELGDSNRPLLTDTHREARGARHLETTRDSGPAARGAHAGRDRDPDRHGKTQRATRER